MNEPIGDVTSSNPSGIDVLTVGHALVDVLASVDDALLAEEGLDKGAMHLIDDDRAHALYSRMGPASEASGGSAANTATGVAACGGTAAFVGAVADDQLGEIFTHDMKAVGVHFDTPPVRSGQATGRSMILVTPDGERTMNTCIGVSSAISFEHLDVALLAAASITYVEGYLFDDAHPLDAWEEVARTIHAAGNRFSVTLSDPFCVERHRPLFRGLVDGPVDVVFGNAEEVCALFEVNDLEVAIDRLAERCEVAAVTLGAKGSVIASGDRRIDVPVVATDVVDTTGAGDLYASGVLTGLAKGWSLEDCGRLGSHAAAAIVAQMGARLTQDVVIG